MISSKKELLPAESPKEAPTAPETHFVRVLPSGPTKTSEYLTQTSPRYANFPVGSSVEISPSAFRIARKIAELLQLTEPSDAGGSALIMDYGDDKAFGDSIRVCFKFPYQLSRSIMSRVLKITNWWIYSTNPEIVTSPPMLISHT